TPNHRLQGSDKSAQFRAEIIERAGRRDLHVEPGHGERPRTGVARLCINEQRPAFLTRRPDFKNAALRGFDRIDLAAKPRFGTLEVDEARLPNQYVEAKPFVQQLDQTDL